MPLNATALLILLHLLLQILKANAKVSSIIVFGDSSVDSGNNNYIPTILKSNFEPYGRDFFGGQATGRFSNGRIATDFIAEAFGIKQTVPAYLDPSYNITDFATGVCFASAGTGYDTLTSDVLTVIPLWKEIEYFKEYQARLKDYAGEDEAGRILNEALYLISLGTNDFLENYFVLPYRPSEYSVEEYQNFLVKIAENFIRELCQLGGRKISLGGIPPMGCLPLERTENFFLGGGCIEFYNNVAKSFNQKLQDLVGKLNQELSGIQLVFSNPYDILSQIIQNPHYFGFENAANGCCGTGRFEMSYLCEEFSPYTCSNANGYVFWDSFHPSERTNAIVAYQAVRSSLGVFL